MLERLRPGAFIRQRSRRLLLPLLFGVLVVVPAQAYYEVIEKFGYRGSFTDFTGLYLSGYGGFCSAGSCLVLPTWNHLWFVPYLWVYTLLLALLTLALGPRLERLSHGLAQALAGWRILLLPLAVLALARIALLGRFAPTHALVDDWSNHAQYLPLFLLGALLARRREFWARLELLRRPSLAIALGCWALLLLYRAVPDGLMAPEQLGFWRDLQRAVYALCGWSAIMAVCGFAHRHLQFDHPLRRYLTQAVFPVYIVHQTLIVLFSQWLKPAELAPGSEGLLLVGLTFCVSFGLFEVVRRVPLLRPFFGLAKQQRRGRAAAQPRHASGNRG